MKTTIKSLAWRFNIRPSSPGRRRIKPDSKPDPPEPALPFASCSALWLSFSFEYGYKVLRVACLHFVSLALWNLSLMAVFPALPLSPLSLPLVICPSFNITFMNRKAPAPADYLWGLTPAGQTLCCQAGSFSFLSIGSAFQGISLPFLWKFWIALLTPWLYVWLWEDFAFCLCPPGYLFLPLFPLVVNCKGFSISDSQVLWSLSQLLKSGL